MSWALRRIRRQLEDVFDLQDELTHTISSTLLQKFHDTETKRAWRKTPRNLSAYDHYVRAFGLTQTDSREEIVKAKREAEQALEIEPDYARAHMVLAWVYANRVWAGWADDLGSDLEHCRTAALRAIECDKHDFWGYGALAFAELFARNHDRALNAIDRAVALNPNNTTSEPAAPHQRFTRISRVSGEGSIRSHMGLRRGEF